MRGIEPGTRQAARPWWPILPFEVEEDPGMGLCWSHSCFHRHGPYIPWDWLLVGLSDLRDNLEGEWRCSTKQGLGGSEIWEDGMPAFQFQPGTREALWASVSPSENRKHRWGWGRLLSHTQWTSALSPGSLGVPGTRSFLTC